MVVLSTLFGLAMLALRIAVPIYLYQQASQRRYPVPWLWIIFGILEPIIAVMLYYVLAYIVPELKK